MKMYIAGPMRGYPKFNFPAFDAARDQLTALGHTSISPADLDRQSGFHETQTWKNDEERAQFLRECIMRDVDAICNGGVEAILLIEGWRKSKGVAVEKALCDFLGIPAYVFFDGRLVKFDL